MEERRPRRPQTLGTASLQAIRVDLCSSVVQNLRVQENFIDAGDFEDATRAGR